MTDHKQVIGSDKDETAHHEKLGAEDGGHTNNVQHLDFTSAEDNTPYSVLRLEKDLQTLHKKWQMVEQEMSDREEKVTILQRKLESARDEYDSLAEQKQALKVELEEEKAAVGSRRNHISKLETRNKELRVQIQELEDYVDSRKSDWKTMEAQVRDYEDALKGLNKSVESHEAAIARKDEEKAALTSRLEELEQELVELSGKHGKREQSHADLQQSLKDQSRELRSLNSETSGLKKEVARLEKTLERRDKTVESLRSDLKKYEHRELQVDSALASEKAALEELQKRHDSRIAELELEARDSKKQERQLRGDAAKAAGTIEELRHTVSKLEVRIDELETMAAEADSERETAEAELEAQRELVQTLEHELKSKRSDLDLLDESVDRIAAIRDGIRSLDVQIDGHWDEPQKIPDNVEEIFEDADEELMAPEELLGDVEEPAEHFIETDDDSLNEQIRYPLVGKSITIGRGQENDIRIDSRYISRVHVRIILDGPIAIVEDAGSTNGFNVNSKRVTRHRLVDGDELELGKSRFRYGYGLS